jgi:DNA repair protein SbcC/Rad50
MIIRSIKAENVLKYRLLDIVEVPASGVIGISGPNESGKSSIGEAICFALFGRTFSLASQDIGKIIRWGEERCSVWLRLAVKGKEYEIARFLDADGNHSARLTELGEASDPIARGVAGVSAALRDVLGYDFEEFIESFYLAQREITAPHPHSHAVKIMAGVAPLEACAEAIRDEIQRAEATLEDLASKVQDVDTQIAEVGLEPGHLEALERERRAIREREQERAAEIAGLRESSASYAERLGEWRSATGGRSTARLLRFVLLLLGLALGGGWGLLVFAPDSPAADLLKGWLNLGPQAGSLDLAIWLAVGSGAAFLLALLAWYRCSDLGAQIKRSLAGNEEFTIRLEELDELPADSLSLIGPFVDAEGGEGEAAVLSPPDGELRARLRERISQMAADADEVRGAVEREITWLQAQAETLGRERDALDQSIEVERRRIEQANKLTGMRDGLAAQIDEHKHRIAVRRVAGDLLMRASRQSSHRFNHNLRGLVSHTLPLFTEGSYEHLQINDDLNVRVFSAEKRDFMELDEISSGTQRQIMLALRLALSQQLVDRVIRDHQFVFLDEPFAFFDDRRTRSALEVLPQLSDDVRQIWVVAQQFPQDVRFDQRIVCDRQRNSLEAKVI